MRETYLNPVSVSRSFVDLRPFTDDRRVLHNPHKGWYMHYVDNGLHRSYYRDGLEKGDHLEDFPALNHLYLRIDWCDIEPREGEFDFGWIDDIFAEWAPYGYRFAFRVCTFVSNTPFSTPEWVKDAGAKGTTLTGLARCATGPVELERWEPDYGDAIFLEKLENMMRAFGAKYNGHPLVEFVDVGTFGTWGEGHTTSGTCRQYPAEVLRRHVDLHLKYLPDTTVLLNDDMVGHINQGEGAEAALAFTDYCAARGMGARDDSTCVVGPAATFGYDTLRQGHFFDAFWENQPVDMEFAHYHMIPPEVFKDGYPFIEALRRSHATYAGFHTYPRKWLEERKYLTDYIGNRLGYWYFITGVDLPACFSGFDTVAYLDVENRGWGKAYNPFTLAVYALGENGEYELYRADGLNLRWVNQCRETMKLNFRHVPPGKYELAISLTEGGRAIELAMLEERRRGNKWALCSFEVK